MSRLSADRVTINGVDILILERSKNHRKKDGNTYITKRIVVPGEQIYNSDKSTSFFFSNRREEIWTCVNNADLDRSAIFEISEALFGREPDYIH